MQLRVLRAYRCRELRYEPGIIEIPDSLGEWLMRDSPGRFERVVEIETGALDAPPADKMMRRKRVKHG